MYKKVEFTSVRIRAFYETGAVIQNEVSALDFINTSVFCLINAASVPKRRSMRLREFCSYF